jgi:hypothetical protein
MDEKKDGWKEGERKGGKGGVSDPAAPLLLRLTFYSFRYSHCISTVYGTC